MSPKLLHIVALFILLILVIFFVKFLISLKNVKRISAFSIDSSKFNNNFELKFFTFLHKMSQFISKFIIFNTIAKSYNKYLKPNDQKLKSGMDFISLKILCGAFFLVLYLFCVALYQTKLNSILLFFLFLLGFFSVDAYLKIKKETDDKINVSDILSSIIIITNNLKANRSLEQAINSVIRKSKSKIATEYQKVLHDMNLGLSISEAFHRMYERTKIQTINHISKTVSLVNKSGINIIEIFSQIEEDLIEEQKILEEKKQIEKFNHFFYLVLLFVPFVLLTILLLNHTEIFLLKRYFLPIILVEGPLYLFYILVLFNTLRSE